MIKRTHGWLCRDRNGVLVFYDFDTEPCIDKWGMWGCVEGEVIEWASPPSGLWNKTYDCNFKLPKPGEKVEIWIEL